MSCGFESHWNQGKALFCSGGASGERRDTAYQDLSMGRPSKPEQGGRWDLEGDRSQTSHHPKRQGFLGRLRGDALDDTRKEQRHRRGRESGRPRLCLCAVPMCSVGHDTAMTVSVGLVFPGKVPDERPFRTGLGYFPSSLSLPGSPHSLDCRSWKTRLRRGLGF